MTIQRVSTSPCIFMCIYASMLIGVLCPGYIECHVKTVIYSKNLPKQTGHETDFKWFI